MASEEFKEGAEQKRPNVQVGDPFMEKLLLEACIEAMRTGAVVGIQDMGAAGLTCSTCEMGARGGVGLEVELDHVPQRESGMTAYEIMLSESQERMLLVADKNREAEVIRVFEKWGLDAVIAVSYTHLIPIPLPPYRGIAEAGHLHAGWRQRDDWLRQLGPLDQLRIVGICQTLGFLDFVFAIANGGQFLWTDPGPCIDPVSYTHLDVYKRQLPASE